MEGLIPFVYRAIVQYTNGGRAPLGVFRFDESPSGSYMQLPGESGRLRLPEIQLFALPSPSRSPAPAKQPVVYQSYQQAA